MINFDPKTKSAEISYQQLAETTLINDYNGDLPKQCPVHAGSLITRIVEAVQAFTKLEPTVQPIVIQQQFCGLVDSYKKQNRQPELHDYTIRRLATKIILPVDAFAGTVDHMQPGVAITYLNSEGAKGMQLAFGENVNVCQNLTAFGKFHYSTFGNGKVSFDQGMELLFHWLQNYMIIHQGYIQKVTELKARSINKARFHQLLGSILEKAVRYNAGERELSAPLNQTQLAAMIRQGNDILKIEDAELTAWDVFNWGTDILKPATNDMPSIIKSNVEYADFILTEMGIDPIEYEIV